MFFNFNNEAGLLSCVLLTVWSNPCFVEIRFQPLWSTPSHGTHTVHPGRQAPAFSCNNKIQCAWFINPHVDRHRALLVKRQRPQVGAFPERCGCTGKWQDTSCSSSSGKPHGACENQEAISFHGSQEIPKAFAESPHPCKSLGSKGLRGYVFQDSFIKSLLVSL